MKRKHSSHHSAQGGMSYTMLGQDPNKTEGFRKEKQKENKQKESRTRDFKPGISRSEP